MKKGLLFIAMPLVLISCISQERCLDRFPPGEKTERIVEIIKRDTLVEGGSVETLIKLDTILLPGQRVTVVDKKGLAELTYYKDAYGNLIVDCAAKDRVIEGLNSRKLEKEIVEKVHTIKEKYVPWWIYALLGITSSLGIFGLLVLKPWKAFL